MKHQTQKNYDKAIALGLEYKSNNYDCISKEHTCPSGKDVYLTFNKAKKALKMRDVRGNGKEVYKCHICGHYHLTTKDGKDRRPARYSRKCERSNRNQVRLFLEQKSVIESIHSKCKPDRPKRYVIRNAAPTL